MRFSEEETEHLLGQNGCEAMPSILSKVAALKANECGDSSGNPTTLFRRNLKAVLEWRLAHPKKGKA